MRCGTRKVSPKLMPSSACTLSNTASSRCSSTACGVRVATCRCSSCPCWLALPLARSRNGCSGSFPAASATCVTYFSMPPPLSAGCSSARVSIRRIRGAFVAAPGSLRRIGVLATVVGLLFAAFVYSVHIGVEIQEPRRRPFRSRYDASALAALAEARRAEWAASGTDPAAGSRSREDQYLERGTPARAGAEPAVECRQHRAAWCENRILEKFYAPVLDDAVVPDAKGHAGRTNSARTRAGVPGRRQRPATSAAPTRPKVRTSFGPGPCRYSGWRSPELVSAILAGTYALDLRSLMGSDHGLTPLDC